MTDKPRRKSNFLLGEFARTRATRVSRNDPRVGFRAQTHRNVRPPPRPVSRPVFLPARPDRSVRYQRVHRQGRGWLADGRAAVSSRAAWRGAHPSGAGWIIDRCAPTSPRDVSGVRGERTDCTQSRRPVPTSIRAARATLNGAPPRGCPCRRLELCNPAPRVPSPRRARSPTPAGLSPREAHRPPALSPVLVLCPAAPPPN